MFQLEGEISRVQKNYMGEEENKIISDFRGLHCSVLASIVLWQTLRPISNIIFYFKIIQFHDVLRIDL